MWKYILAFPLVMHGLANLAGFFEAFFDLALIGILLSPLRDQIDRLIGL
jgi:hypothetical protein